MFIPISGDAMPKRIQVAGTTASNRAVLIKLIEHIADVDRASLADPLVHIAHIVDGMAGEPARDPIALTPTDSWSDEAKASFGLIAGWAAIFMQPEPRDVLISAMQAHKPAAAMPALIALTGVPNDEDDAVDSLTDILNKFDAVDLAVCVALTASMMFSLHVTGDQLRALLPGQEKQPERDFCSAEGCMPGCDHPK